MSNKKGFTLVELLAVIVVLAVILVIAIPNIIKIIDKAKKDAYTRNESMLITAGRNYVTSYPDNIPVNIGTTTKVLLSDLQSKNLISDIKDNKTNNNCDGYILITKVSNNEYNYTPYLICGTSYTSSTSITNGLVGSWTFSGNANDSINTNNGTVTGATLTTDRFGNTNSAYSFDGSSYINLGTSPILKPNNITISVWTNASSLINSWHGIISNMTSWGTGFGLQIGPNQKIAAMVSGTYLTTNWAPSTNVWYHIVATHNSVTNENKLYVNGTLENTSVVPVAYEANAKTYIGVFYTTPNLYFYGTIDDVKIYNRALSAEEIKYNYDAESSNNK